MHSDIAFEFSLIALIVDMFQQVEIDGLDNSSTLVSTVPAIIASKQFET
jgi:hypothetical protein